MVQGSRLTINGSHFTFHV